MAPQEEPQASRYVPPELPPLAEPEPEEATAPPMSEIGRIVGVFSSPPAAFRDIVARPRWWVPVVLLAIMSTIFATAFSSRVGFDRVIRQQIEASPQAANMSPAQMQNAIQIGSRIAQFAQYGAIISILIALLVVAAVLKFLFDTIMGADVGFKRMMAIVSYAWLPGVISTALALLVLNLKPPEDFNINNPLAFNLGAFLSSESPLWMRSLGASIDLFSLWTMLLLAVGVSVASRKISFTKALVTVMFPWALYVALKVGAVALRGA